jgi:hypothetical protein
LLAQSTSNAKSELAHRASCGRHVIANRASSGRFLSSYCGVSTSAASSASFAGGSMPRINRSHIQWKNAVAIAQIVDRKLAPTQCRRLCSSMRAGVSPGWRLTRVATLGNHVFYR